MHDQPDRFSAGEQALGYMYQVRFALLKLMELPEDVSCYIEKDDDVDMTDPEEGQLLASLKHKAPGDRLTDLSPDFWKSIRIWLARFQNPSRDEVSQRYFLFTTGTVAEGTFLQNFLPDAKKQDDVSERAKAILKLSESKLSKAIKAELEQLDPIQSQEFFGRISILDSQPRIEEIPAKVMDRMRTVRSICRISVYERLEGWWTNLCIELMTGKRIAPAYGRELSEALSSFSDQFRVNSLPIDFRGKEPPEGVDEYKDDRIFVHQLRVLGISAERIRRAILDYYQAFEQRALWAREHLTIGAEVEEYDERLVDEWNRFRAIACENIDGASSEEIMASAGKEILRWIETNNSPNLRIRSEVTEAYVMVGSYHMLANHQPEPRVYWHPQFLSRLKDIVTKKAT
ncbi:MAG: ABC-three component system protein [Planctomycetota bacterium]